MKKNSEILKKIIERKSVSNASEASTLGSCPTFCTKGSDVPFHPDHCPHRIPLHARHHHVDRPLQDNRPAGLDWASASRARRLVGD